MSSGARAGQRSVLVVGGAPAVRMAWCRLLGDRGLRVSLLRWPRRAAPAEWSRHCTESLWLGDIDAGVDAWREALDTRLRSGRYTDVLPVDALALAVLCEGRLALPPGVRFAGPARPEIWQRGVDRLGVFHLAQASGWQVPSWQHVAHAGAAVPADRELVVRPRWDVRISGDAPARFSTRRVAGSSALDSKLRDDVPRGEVLLQEPPVGRNLRLCAVVREGRLLGCWRWPVDGHPGAQEAPWHEAVGTLAKGLGWTGLIEIEATFSEFGPMLLDVYPGGDVGFARLVQGGSWARPGTDAGSDNDVVSLIAMPAPKGGRDLAPRVAAPLLALRTLCAKAHLRMRAALTGVTMPGSVPLRLPPAASVLIVCKGNINRSIVAEQLLRAAGVTHTASAGLLGLAGRRPSRAAEAFLDRTLGVRPGGLRSRSVREALRSDGPFDVVLCFERRQLVELAERHPELRGRLHLFGALAQAGTGPIEIADPHGGAEEDYRACFERIRSVVEAATSHASRAASGAARPGML
jgi:protein-tyrosine-phosphatase